MDKPKTGPHLVSESSNFHPTDEELGADFLDELPEDFMVELQAANALHHMKNLASARLNRRANESLNDAEASRLLKVELASTKALALIKHDYPESLKLAKVLASREAEMVRNIRGN